MIQSKWNIIALTVSTVGINIAYLFVYCIIIVIIAFVEQAFHAVGRGRHLTIGFTLVDSQYHTNSAGMFIDCMFDAVKIDVSQKFITVDDQHVVMGCFLKRKVPGGTEVIDPFKVINVIRIFGGQLFGAVCGSGIYIDDLEAIGYKRGQASLNIFFFIFTDNTY